MLTEDNVAEAAAAAGLPGTVRFVPLTGSTNSDCLRLAEQGAPEWTVLVAGQQESGRGRLGRSWISTPGSSLLCSVLLRPVVPPAEAPLLSLAAAVAAARAAGGACGVEVRCKWPNDLLAGGRKLGGVLAEAVVTADRIAHVVVGVGLNGTQGPGDFPTEIRDSATSVVMQGGRADLPGLLRAYLVELQDRYGDGGRGLGERVLDAYRGLCDSLGRQVRVDTTAGTVVEGRGADLGPLGELVVDTADGRRQVAFGEVTHLR